VISSQWFCFAIVLQRRLLWEVVFVRTWRPFFMRVIISFFLLPLSLIAFDEPAKQPGRTDLYGDPLPAGAIVRLGTVRFRHDFMIQCVAYSPDGMAVAVGGSWNGVGIFDVATGRQILAVPKPRQVLAIAYSRDGKLLAMSAGGRGNTRLLDAASGETIAELSEAQDVVFSFSFSPDNRTVAGAERDGAVHLWDVATGRELRSLPHERGVWSVAFAPDGKTLASGGRDKLVHIWDGATGKELRQMAGHQEEVVGVAFSPDGKRLASASEDASIRLWDPSTGKEVRTLEGKHGQVRGVAFAPDGQSLACGNDDGTIQIWNPATGTEERNWQAHGEFVKRIAFSPDGTRIVSAAPWECGPSFWDAATGERVPPLDGHSTLVEFVAFAPDGQSLFTSARRDSRLLKWDLATAQPRTWAKLDNSGITACAVTADGRMAATLGQKDKALRLWDLAAGVELRKLGPYDSDTGMIRRHLAFSPDGKILAVGNITQGVELVDVTTGMQIKHLEGPPGATTVVQFSPDGKMLAAGVKHQFKSILALWNLSDGRQLPVPPATSDVFTFAFSPDSRLLVIAGIDNSARMLHLASGKNFPLLADSRFGIYGFAFSPDGRLIASAGDERDKSIHVWEVASRQEVFQFTGHLSWALAVAFSPDGKTLASAGSEGSALIWDLKPPAVTPRASALLNDELQESWQALVNGKAPEARRALATLAAAPQQSLPLLRQILKPVRAIAEERLRRLTNDLASDQFAVREQAAKELEAIGPAAETFLRRELKEKLTLESRRRIERLLERLDNEPLSGVSVAQCRGLELLEHIANADARQLLKELAEGLPEASLTQEAKVILERLGKH
jgi:WD40 repeat protein